MTGKLPIYGSILGKVIIYERVAFLRFATTSPNMCKFLQTHCKAKNILK